MRIAVGVMTINRDTVNYLAGTLASLQSTSEHLSHSVLVCVGNADTSHIEDLTSVSVIPRQFIDKMPGRGVLYAITANMAHTYEALLTREPKADLFLVIEDDIAFARKWTTVIEKLATMASSRSHNWVLSLCTSHNDDAFSPVAPGLWQHRRALDFWGQQALVYPPTTFRRMRQHVHTCEREWEPSTPTSRVPHNPNDARQGDQAIKWFCHVNNVPIYVPNPSVVNHVGQKCSWGQGADSEAWRNRTRRFVP